MKIDIIAVGKVKEKYLRDGIEEYSKRISSYATLSIISVADEPFFESDSEKRKNEIKAKEGEKILSKLRLNSYVVVCDLNGKEMTSEGLSQFVGDLALKGRSDISFIIGGALGLSCDVVARADFLLCFSKMTFPHQLMRLILLEQVYRAFRIYRNEPYHY